MPNEKLECIDCGSTGPTVEMRYPGYGHKCFPRCESCGERRLERERGNIERNFQSGPIGPPADWPNGPSVGAFDPMDAGEHWGEEDY